MQEKWCKSVRESMWTISIKEHQILLWKVHVVFLTLNIKHEASIIKQQKQKQRKVDEDSSP